MGKFVALTFDDSNSCLEVGKSRFCVFEVAFELFLGFFDMMVVYGSVLFYVEGK